MDKIIKSKEKIEIKQNSKKGVKREKGNHQPEE